jgi:hypothetical protein
LVKFMQYNKGFSTIEILVAMAVLVICVSAVVLILFGGQSMVVDSQTNSEALNKAQELLEKEQALARKDFEMVNPVATASDGIYQTKINVETQADFFTKKITAEVFWLGDHNRTLSVQLSALVTNFENAVGGNTCDSVPSGDWTHPTINSFLVSNTNSGAELSVDAYKEKLYVALSDAETNSAPTLFVYNLTDHQNPNLIGQIDNAAGIKDGINAIRATDKYLYAAKATGPATGQLQIFDVSGSTPTKIGNDFKVPGVIGTGAQALGNSIFYKDGYVFLGLTATNSGPELHIIDVHDPNVPFEVGSWPQTGNLGNDINAIYVKGSYVYLATPDSEELIVLDISNPTVPLQVGGFNPPGSGHGKSLKLVGDKLYLGRTVTSGNPEFYILNNSDPTNLTASASQEISSSVNGLVVRDYLAFLITADGQFQTWRTDNPSGITQYAASLALPSSGKGTALDCEGNYLYAGSIDSSNQGYLSIISAP